VLHYNHIVMWYCNDGVMLWCCAR